MERNTKTETTAEMLNRLFVENGLLQQDVHRHKHYTIITRTGIEKIQYKNQVTVEFQAVTMEPNFCVVKAIAKKPTDNNGFVFVETFGSAGHNANGEPDKGKQYQYLYYPEMAEKRALSRAILKITNFYKLGVYGEDEADDFKNKTGEAIDTPKQEPQPEQPKAMTKEQRTEILTLLKNPAQTSEIVTGVTGKLDQYDFNGAVKAIQYLKKQIAKVAEETAKQKVS